MGLRFLTKEEIDKVTPSHRELTIEDIVRATLSEPVEARGYWKAHSSDLTKSDYCPRKVAFWREAGGPRELEKINPTLHMTFKQGNLTADLFCEYLGGKSVWGNWVCRHCDDYKEHSFKPKPCSCHPNATWKYEELCFEHLDNGASGSIDAFVDLKRNGMLTLVELKIISPDEFEKLLMPNWEHRVRTQMYLEIIKNSDHKAKRFINLDKAKVFYICRTHGKKVRNRVTPFKEFDVPAMPEQTVTYLQKAKEIRMWEETGYYPAPICTDYECDIACKCKFRDKCFEQGGFIP